MIDFSSNYTSEQGFTYYTAMEILHHAWYRMEDPIPHVVRMRFWNKAFIHFVCMIFVLAFGCLSGSMIIVFYDLKHKGKQITFGIIFSVLILVVTCVFMMAINAINKRVKNTYWISLLHFMISLLSYFLSFLYFKQDVLIIFLSVCSYYLLFSFNLLYINFVQCF